LGRDIGVDAVMKENGLDLIAAPGDSSLCVFAASTGYPLAMVPLGVLDYNGRPFGICVIAKAGQEGKLLSFAASYERASPARPLPLIL